MVPERWGQILSELIDVWKLQHTQSQSSLSRVHKDSEEQTKKSNDLLAQAGGDMVMNINGKEIGRAVAPTVASKIAKKDRAVAFGGFRT